MPTPIRFFTIATGLAVALALPFGGFYQYEKHQYAQLVADCHRSNKERGPITLTDESTGKPTRFFWVDACNRDEALSFNRKLSDTERKIVYQAPRPNDLIAAYLGSAGMILLVGALPGVWYFLLRRLGELSRAIRGER